MCSQENKLENQLFINMITATIKARTEEQEVLPIPNGDLMIVIWLSLQVGKINAGSHPFIGCSRDSLLFCH